jgi:hypothetical protein
MILRVEGIPQALLSCPTASIHTREPPTDIKRAHDSFPLAIDPNTIEVYFHPTLGNYYVAIHKSSKICFLICVILSFLPYILGGQGLERNVGL